MLLFGTTALSTARLLETAGWVWPLSLLGVLWGVLWVFGGPWLLAQCLKHRTREHTSLLLDGARLAHAGCWITSTSLPLLAVLGWMFDR